jgi:hypothetical protein
MTDRPIETAQYENGDGSVLTLPVLPNGYTWEIKEPCSLLSGNDGWYIHLHKRKGSHSGLVAMGEITCEDDAPYPTQEAILEVAYRAFREVDFSVRRKNASPAGKYLCRVDE